MISKRQKEVFDFIKTFIKDKKYSPSLEEIKDHFGFASVSTAHHHVKALQDSGYLQKEDNQPRAIDINLGEALVEIPLVGTIAAGYPIEAVLEHESIAVPKSKLPKGSMLFALRVKGDSMIDENIEDGDIVISKSQPVAENGQRVVALIDNKEATLKKFYKEKGHIRLQPANQNYDPIIIQPQQLQIQGIVIDVVKSKKSSETYVLPKHEGITKNAKHTELIEFLNTIKCIDCVEGMKKLPENSIDLTVTSPPYDDLRGYKGYDFDFENIAKELYRVTKIGGVVVWVVGDQANKGDETGSSFRQALFFKQVGFNLFDTMIYMKTPRGAVGNNKTYWQAFEYMFILSKGSPNTINLIRDRENKDARDGDNGTKRLHDGTLLKQKRTGYSKFGRRTNVWEYLIGRGHSASDNVAYKHPAIFPEKLVQDHIKSWTNPGDVVLDPMCGSGTTCKMAKLYERAFIGMDISSEYCKIAEERLKKIALL